MTLDRTRLLELLAGDRAEDLDEEESRALAEALAGDAELRAALGAAEEELAPLVELMEPPQPAPSAWARVDHLVAALGAPAGGGGQVVPFRPRRSMPVWLAAAAAALFVLGVGLLFPLDPFLGAPEMGSFMAPEPPARPPGALDDLPRVDRLQPGPGYAAEQIMAREDLLVVQVRDERPGGG